MRPFAAERILDDYREGTLDRRSALRGLAACFAAAFAAEGIFANPGHAFQATGLNHLALRVADVARSRDFYVEHFGAAVLEESAPHNCFLEIGEHFLALFRGTTPGMDHFCFTIEDFDPGDVVKRLEAQGLSARRVEDRVYFEDPDGLEGQLSGRYSNRPGPASPAR